MSHYPSKTYELSISFGAERAEALRTKALLLDWLLVNGVESFVEGAIDVDHDYDYENPEKDYYEALGGDLAPVLVYRYSLESLEDLKAKLLSEFKTRIEVALGSLETEVWMEGWKESFKPFATERFYVYPPWEKAESAHGKIPLVIQPGMAFGTGQHATTRLCLGELERIAAAHIKVLAEHAVLDVGTGTGILAIAARKLGYGVVAATDIEDDAILATMDNAKENQTAILVKKGSVPDGPAVELVLANILAVVLKKIMPDLSRMTKPGGTLVLSGLLVEEEDEMLKRAAECELTLKTKSTDAGWSCLVLAKP